LAQNNVQHFINNLQRFTILPNINKNLAAKRYLKNPRWYPFKIKKGCPAPQHKNNSCQLILILTNLSFRIKSLSKFLKNNEYVFLRDGIRRGKTFRVVGCTASDSLAVWETPEENLLRFGIQRRKTCGVVSHTGTNPSALRDTTQE
jgi:hypothetical protein